MFDQKVRDDLLTEERLSQLRFEQDDIASEALEKLYEIVSENEPSVCPVPKGDLYATLEQHRSEHPALQKLWDQTNTVPEWVDWEQIERGQSFFYRYAAANMLGFALQGFISENVAALGPAEVLTRTGGLSKNTLMKRIWATFQWVLEATESPESMRPGGKGHASTIRVRLLHASVRHRITQLATKKPSYFDIDDFGIPINLFDSVLTIKFFCCNPILIQLPRFGITPKDDEIEGYIALYRYISYLIGSPPEYFSSTAQAQATTSTIMARHEPPSRSSRKIADTFIDCLTDSPPLYLSRGLINAGCRQINSSELCDYLGIPESSWYSNVQFKTVIWLTIALNLVQRTSKRVDDFFIAVRNHKPLLKSNLDHRADCSLVLPIFPP